MGVFEKCVMVLELKTLPIKQKNKLKTEIKENGGIISYVLDKKCTHVIVSHMKDVSSHRLKSIQQFQIPVVSVEYVSKCIEEGRLVDEDAYAPAEHPDVIQNTNCKNPGEEISPLSEAFPGDDQEETVKNKDSLDKFRIYSGREGSLPHFPSVFEVAKYSLFNKVTADSEAGVVVELQCSIGNPALPFCVSRYWGEWNNSKVMQMWKDLIFAPTSEEAVKAYELFIKDLQDKDFQQQTKLSTELNLLASEKVKKLLLEEALSSSSISQEVTVFVELIWTEALGCFDDVLASPVNSISPNDVSRAEGILLQARKAMDEGVDQNGLRGIMSEFYTILQHKHRMDFNITKKMISTKLDLCQLIRDIVNASEATLWSPTPSSLAKYQALRCSVEHVAPNTEEFSTIKELLMHRNESLTSVRIHQIFRIGRVNEMLDFQSQLGNVQPLFHASSASSFVGILSRGLLLPKVAVEQHGIDRTDIGNLGCGIYFSNALSTILKYSKPSESDGTRLLVVCDIALGECKHLHKKDFTLASAPAGYSSVLGVRQTADVASEFQDDEYVVYNPSQVQIKYVVQFCVGEDQVKSFQPTVNVTNEETPAGLSDPPAVTDADSDEEYTNPLDSVTEGLQDSSGNKIPLKSVHVKGRMVDLLAQIIVFQTYTNHSVVPIEAKYVFPLDETAAVCGFEAFINGKHVVGEVKEKEKARQEYRQAIQEGHGAYLMDQEAPDVFTISVGNLPPSATVLIKITYVTELAIEFGSIVFRLPGSVAPWQQSKALNERTQDTVEKICVNDMEETGSGFALDMSVEMPHEITSIWSGTHKIKVKKTQCKAVVITEENSSLGPGGFSLTIDLSEVYLPRMWVEKHPDKDSQACMLVFCPEFASSSFIEDCEVVIFLDSSNSMRGAVLQEARKIALRLLNSLHCKLNVVIFGTDYKELFPCPQDDVLEAAKQFIMFSPPLMGNTDLWRPLRNLSLLAPSKGVRNIVLISDGHIQSEGLTLRLVKENAHHTRIFTCGVGHTANRHMLRSLAQSGGGAYEFFDMKTKHNWREKIALQVIRMVSPGCSSVSVKWQQFNPNASQPVQAPAQLHSVFSGNQLLVYGFVPHCTQATLSGVVSNQEIQTMVSTTELQKTKGTMLHKLTARAIIRDYEYGNLHTDETEHEVRKAALKSFVIDLSKEYSIVTQYTSFVAIEKRGENETTEGIDAVTTDERIAEEDVDFLPYLTWERAEDDFGESLEEELSLCGSQNVPTSDYMWIEEGGDAVELQTSLWRDPKHHDAFAQQSFPGLEPVPQVPDGLPVPVITYQAARCLKMHSSPPPPPPPPPSALYSSKTIPEGFTHSAVTGIERAQNTVSAPVVFSSYSSIGGPALKMPERSGYTQPFSGFGSGQQLPSNSSSEFSKGAFGVGSGSVFGNTSAVSDPANAAFASASGFTFGENSIFSQPASNFAFSSGRTFEQSPCIDLGLVEFDSSSDLCLGISNKAVPEECSLAKSKSRSKKLSSLTCFKHLVCDAENTSLANESLLPPKFAPILDTAEMNQLQTKLRKGKMRRKVSAGQRSETFPIRCSETREDLDTPSRSRASLLPWTQLFDLQHQDGYWQFSPELGSLLHMDVDYFANVFLKEKGILSLGVKSSEEILRLVATMLVLQLIRYMEQLEGLIFKSLFQLDDTVHQRSEHWGSVKKAVDWVKVADWRYPSIYWRLELGRDWESTTRQLLCIDPVKQNSPLQLVRITCFKPGCFPKGGLS
ncbi:protein mono-ADP-ribosyltransferase PARP4-like isoform X4 [Acipenser ruthenus]|uniref:protein mono-ADP-ribosyltransferase PARP4-like isoform X4 n=1 Tax=Acipenser ruthenus TaxID=7906 RepID=UPI0027417F44|nr:protein mono-ADP-ribosyltransferase PARP4-like isoform X4 [Acipenser ruthenus]